MLARVLVAVVALLVVGSCGSGSGTSSNPEPTTADPTSADPTTPDPATPDPTVPDPTLTAKPPAPSRSITGVVGGEGTCLTLTEPARATWLLVGSTGGVVAGDRVTVRGSPAPDLATRCQQGTPFVVETVEPG